MYKVVVTNCGDYGNVVVGSRYCLTKKSASRMAKTFRDYGCDFKIFKFIHIHSDVFMWAVDYNIYNGIT